jgi:hypothetical protein
MGTYTELSLNAQLKANTPVEVRDLLTLLFDDTHDIDELDAKPRHPFFHDGRASFIGCISSQRPTGFNFPNLVVHTEVKNYEQVLNKFLDWIAPYIESVDDHGYWEPDNEDVVSDVILIDGRFALRSRERDKWGEKSAGSLTTLIENYPDLSEAP